MTTRPTIYDPRLGQTRTFEIYAGNIVSSLHYRFWIMEAPNGSFARHESLLTEVFGAVEGCAFATYVPWGPDRNRQRDVFVASFMNVAEISGGALLLGEYRDQSSQIVSHVFHIRESLGGDASGTWSLGVATSFDDLHSSILAAGSSADSPIFGMAASMQIIGCGLCLDDGLDMLFLRLTTRTDRLLVA